MIIQWTWVMVIWVAVLGGDHRPIVIENIESQAICQTELDRIIQFSNGTFKGVCINKANKR